MKHGSLFSGIGGFDLAAQWMGWENVFHCEWNDFGKKVLKYYWPNAISYDDITKTDFTTHRGGIDILTGGFPCQPYSAAGKRKGTDDSRHLWPEMLRAIREIQPSYIVGENVSGLLSWSGGLVFEQVQIDLENEGYQVTPYLLPACGKNAPHKRERVWFLAYSHATGKRGNEWEKEIKSNVITDPRLFGQAFDEKQTARVEQCNKGDVTDSDIERLQRGMYKNGGERKISTLNASKFCSSCIGRSSWENFPTQPPICGGNDGLPDRLDGITFLKWRNESIKGYGNAIVPQVAHEIFKAIEKTEQIILSNE